MPDTQTVFEFDVIVPAGFADHEQERLRPVPADVYLWLESKCLELSASERQGWLRLVQKRGRRGVQVTSFAGVIRAPNGYQIEVLPKVGKAIGGGASAARELLIDMLQCLREFSHIRSDSARLRARRMPLLEVFVAEFLQSVQSVVKRGVRSSYSSQSANIAVLRGKLLVADQLRQNLCRADRFFVEFDEFSADRAENRILRAALQSVLEISSSAENLRLGRELEFAFAEVPVSVQPMLDYKRVSLDRNMRHYAEALSWAKLILAAHTPSPTHGDTSAPSLLYPMERLFEAFVAQHLPRQLPKSVHLREQVCTEHLVRHRGQKWFTLVPDLVVRRHDRDVAILDTKWKLIDSARSNGVDKYQLSQGDFYQLLAYGHSYLSGDGDLALVFPKTDTFLQPLPVFDFPAHEGLRLWALPFCIASRRLLVPPNDTSRFGAAAPIWSEVREG